jgi:glutathione S-transferase
MGLTFYFAPESTASVTEAVLAELGIVCERVRLDIDAGDTRKPDFLAVNPNGRVPAIVHDGVALWESAALTIYLGEVFGVEIGLFPPPGSRRGQAMTWIVWTNTALAEAAGRLSAQIPAGSEGAVQHGSVDLLAPEHQWPDALERAKADVAAHFRVLDGALKGRSFLLDDYCIADTHLWVIVGWAANLGVDLADFANLKGWMERCAARPALADLSAG